MKVIFIKNLKNQGKINEIKEVKDGYATNFLIKNGYAVAYTKGSLNRLNNEIAADEKREKEAISNAEKIKNKLEKEKLEFSVKTGKDSRVFVSISSKQIVDKLEEIGYKIDKKDIIINDPINTLGSHVIEVSLHKKVKAKLMIVLKEK